MLLTSSSKLKSRVSTLVDHTASSAIRYKKVELMIINRESALGKMPNNGLSRSILMLPGQKEVNPTIASWLVLMAFVHPYLIRKSEFMGEKQKRGSQFLTWQSPDSNRQVAYSYTGIGATVTIPAFPILHKYCTYCQEQCTFVL